MLLISALVGAPLLFALTLQWFQNADLWDFSTTFYRSAQYLLRGEPVYVNAYPHLDNNSNYPPYNPIWILYFAVPFSAYPLDVAETLRFWVDVLAVPLLAYLCTRAAQLRHTAFAVILAIAPWHFSTIYDGQWSAFALLGALVCYVGARRMSPSAMAVGLWLALVKPNITILVVAGTLLFAQRQRVLLKTLFGLSVLILVSSLQQPTWLLDLLQLYAERFLRPQPERYPSMVLPGYPWTQFALTGAMLIFLIAYVWKTQAVRPTLWLWTLLISASLASALHAFIYDWLIMTLPLAWLLQCRFGIMVVMLLYAYPFFWIWLPPLQRVGLFSPLFIPLALAVVVLSSAIAPASTSVRLARTVTS